MIFLNAFLTGKIFGNKQFHVTYNRVLPDLLDFFIFILFFGTRTCSKTGPQTKTKFIVSGSTKLPIMCQLLRYKAIHTNQDLSLYSLLFDKNIKTMVDCI